MAEARTAKTAKQESKVDYRSREHRKPLTGKQLRMQVDEEAFRKAGLRPLWALDNGTRLKQLIEAGYRFVSKIDDGVPVEQDERDGAIFIEAAGRDRHTGKPVNQYLMAIPLDFYEEDQQRKREQRDQTLNRIRQGQFETGALGDNLRANQPGMPRIKVDDGRNR